MEISDQYAIFDPSGLSLLNDPVRKGSNSQREGDSLIFGDESWISSRLLNNYSTDPRLTQPPSIKSHLYKSAETGAE